MNDTVATQRASNLASIRAVNGVIKTAMKPPGAATRPAQVAL